MTAGFGRAARWRAAAAVLVVASACGPPSTRPDGTPIAEVVVRPGEALPPPRVVPRSPAREGLPNIVLVVADDLGVGQVGAYGQREIDTPNLDRLAAEGTRFTQAYAGSAICAPSRAVLLTGLHTGHARVRGNSTDRPVVPPAEFGEPRRVPLEPGDVTVADVLAARGYATGAVGKWGLGEPGSTGEPWRRGFDDWLGFLNQNRADDHYARWIWHNDVRLIFPGNRGGAGSDYLHDRFTEHALRFVETHRARPFFLYLAYTLPHKDWVAPELGPYADRDWTGRQRSYAAMVSRLDRDVGRLLERIAQLGLDDRTIVFFTSDNGPVDLGREFEGTSPLRGHKAELHEGGLRVPLIVRAPGRVPSGRTSDAVVGFADFLPTVAELAGADPLPGLDGVSAAGELQGSGPIGERLLYWELETAQAVRRGRWKAIRGSPDEPTRLYDLERDPGESVDLAGREPEIAAELERALRAEHRPDPLWPALERAGL